MSDLHKCPNCGGLTKEKGHLCAPVPHQSKCGYCEGMVENARHVCMAMRENLQYVCEACGRMAVEADVLCQPAKIQG